MDQSVAAFEQSVRDQISGQKLEAFLTAGVNASEEEVLKDFQRKNTKFDVNYVSVNAAELSFKINAVSVSKTGSSPEVEYDHHGAPF